MVMQKQSRKARRKAEKQKQSSEPLKKGTAVLGSALAVSSIATPIALLPQTAEATENEPSSAEISAQEETTETASTETFGQIELKENESSESTTDPTETSETETTTENSETPETSEPASNLLPKFSAFSTEYSLPKDPAAYIASIAKYAQSIAYENDLYASVMIAQSIVESGWGTSALSQAPYYNFFGVKGHYQNNYVYMDTWEYLNGEWVIKKEKFRKYPSYRESFMDNAEVLKKTSFQQGVYFYAGAWKSNTTSYEDATAWLTGRYATDPNYGTKLNNLIRTYQLTQYDQATAVVEDKEDQTANNQNQDSNKENNNENNLNNNNQNANKPNNNNTNNNSTTNTNKSDTVHTVVSGDTLWGLSVKYGTSIANIKSWNKLSGDTIYVGQKLIVKKNQTTSKPAENQTSQAKPATQTTHTVVSGDTLWGLSVRYGTSVANIKSWNKLSGDTIYVGQKLIVKQSQTSNNTTNVKPAENQTSQAKPATQTTHTVVSGDTLWGLSVKYGTSITNIKSWNKLSSDTIYVGQKLKITAAAASSTSSSQTTIGTSTHVVKSGDTLWGLSQKYQISIQKLKEFNQLTSDTIYIGQKLRLK